MGAIMETIIKSGYGHLTDFLEPRPENSKTFYVLRHAVDDQLFWSNTLGWVETGKETRFTEEHRNRLDLPFVGVWVYCVDDEP